MRYFYELQPTGVRRHYDTEGIARREAKKALNKLGNEIGGVTSVYVQVYSFDTVNGKQCICEMDY